MLLSGNHPPHHFGALSRSLHSSHTCFRGAATVSETSWWYSWEEVSAAGFAGAAGFDTGVSPEPREWDASILALDFWMQVPMSGDEGAALYIGFTM